MKVELTSQEMSVLTQLMLEYKQTHPFNKPELKFINQVMKKFYDNWGQES